MKELFPIKSQTSFSDKKVLLSIIDLYKTDYNYLEIGSFLGGSLTPFLKDENCKLILSIDDREKIQPDERGIQFDYRKITTKLMIENLVSNNFDISKLETFDGSIENYKSHDLKFDLVFIDGEHTDIACFRDFVYSFQLMKKNSICLFHDSYIVYKGIQSCLIYLDVNKIKYQFFKILNTDMSIILLGDNSDINLTDIFLIENMQDFFKKSEKSRIDAIIESSQIKNKIFEIKT